MVSYAEQEKKALDEIIKLYAKQVQRVNAKEVLEFMIKNNYVDLKLPVGEQDNKYKNAISERGAVYRDMMFEYFNKLKNVMDGRKWSTIVYSFIKNFYSTVTQIKTKSSQSYGKRVNTLLSKATNMEDVEQGIQNIANELNQLGKPQVINDQIVFYKDGKLIYPGKKAREGLTLQLRNKLDVLKYYNHSKKLKKQSQKDQKNPNRLATRAFAKSLARKVNAEGLMKKAMQKMTPEVFTGIASIQDVPLVYHDFAVKNTHSGFSRARKILNTRRIEQMQGKEQQQKAVIPQLGVIQDQQKIINEEEAPVDIRMGGELEQPITEPGAVRIKNIKILIDLYKNRDNMDYEPSDFEYWSNKQIRQQTQDIIKEQPEE